MQKLIIEDDEGRTTVVPLVRDELTVGRKEGNTIRLTERNVSRQHARLMKRNGSVLIEDLASYTGVRINGTRIEAPTTLRDGDVVMIGDYKLSVKTEQAADAAATAAAADAPAGGAAPANRPPTAVAMSAAAAVTVPAALDVDGAPEAADGAPTIPVRTLAEQARSAEAPPVQPSRLVVVTTSLGGHEFSVDRASMVIGRTEENDIIVNHPSISRHHAKIVRDGDRYTIVDLQSANGVRVGGEPYERVDVQPGDIIELGHVKLRLVGPDETWTYDPAEFKTRSRRSVKIGAALGSAAIVIGVIVFLQARRDDGDDEAEEGRKPTAAATPAAATAATAPGAPAEPSPQDMLAKATTAAGEEKWEDAVTTLDLLLNRAGFDPAAAAIKDRATALKQKVDLERRSAEMFGAFEEAAKAKEPDVALARFDSIPSTSMYKDRATPSLPAVKEQFLAAHLELADAARAQGRCDDARAEVEKIDQVDPDNRKAHTIAKTCRTVAVAPRAPAPPVSPKVVVAVAAPAPPAAPRPPARVARSTGTTRAASAARDAAGGADDASAARESAVDPAELIRQARAAWLHQQCTQAMDLSRRALRAKGNAGEAHQIIAVCACSMRDREGAVKSYSKLDERNRSMVRSICLKNGVELEE